MNPHFLYNGLQTYYNNVKEARNLIEDQDSQDYRLLDTIVTDLSVLLDKLEVDSD
ncbi:MAG: hypothetical protein R2685_11095 [Candidatus Nitrosocosmicus sp.]|nr:hypothetical protein [Candidatus Nitrosocosmicus sp.]